MTVGAADSPVESGDGDTLREYVLEYPTIAHAGGGLSGASYLNSIEAIEWNYKNRGYKLFEIDFSITRDGRLACIHDWGPSMDKRFPGFEWILGIDPNDDDFVPTLEQFRQLVDAFSGPDPCDETSLARWFNNHPDTYLVTDTKDRRVEHMLSRLSAQFERPYEQIIVQIYYPRQYELVDRMGFHGIIWTLYRVKPGLQEILGHVRSMNLLGVTMPRNRVDRLAPALIQKGVLVWTHTVNNEMERLSFRRNYGSIAVYTDVLPNMSLIEAQGIKSKSTIRAKDRDTHNSPSP